MSLVEVVLVQILLKEVERVPLCPFHIEFLESENSGKIYKAAETMKLAAKNQEVSTISTTMGRPN
jgi:hypothetical protein